MRPGTLCSQWRLQPPSEHQHVLPVARICSCSSSCARVIAAAGDNMHSHQLTERRCTTTSKLSLQHAASQSSRQTPSTAYRAHQHIPLQQRQALPPKTAARRQEPPVPCQHNALPQRQAPPFITAARKKEGPAPESAARVKFERRPWGTLGLSGRAVGVFWDLDNIQAGKEQLRSLLCGLKVRRLTRAIFYRQQHSWLGEPTAQAGRCLESWVLQLVPACSATRLLQLALTLRCCRSC